jgi:hypothetical protein
MSGIETTVTINQMETPHASVGTFELPCGHWDEGDQVVVRDVVVREISGFEEDMLASQVVPGHEKMDNLLAACVTRIGKYDTPGRISQIVKNLPVGDRVFLLFAIRRVTLGDELPVREECPKCKVKGLFMVDIGTELEVKEMPEPAKRVYDTVLPSGLRARFRISTGLDEARIGKQIKRTPLDAMSQALLMRIELLGDEPPTLEAIKRLGMKDRHFLRAEFARVEGGVETSVNFTCASCGNEWSKDLNIGAQGFFFPSAK